MFYIKRFKHLIFYLVLHILKWWGIGLPTGISINSNCKYFYKYAVWANFDVESSLESSGFVRFSSLQISMARFYHYSNDIQFPNSWVRYFLENINLEFDWAGFYVWHTYLATSIFAYLLFNTNLRNTSFCPLRKFMSLLI